MQSEKQDAGGYATAASRDHGLVRHNACIAQGLPQLIDRFISAVMIEQSGKWQIARTGDVTSRLSMHGVFCSARETPGIPGIDYLCDFALYVRQHILLKANALRRLQIEMIFWLRVGFAAFNQPILELPLRNPAIED